MKGLFVDTPVLHPCCCAFVLPILENFSPVWESAAECYLHILERQVYLLARLFPDQTLFLLCHRRHVAALCMLNKVNSNSNHLLFSEFSSTSVRVRHVAAAAHPLEFAVSWCRTPQFARCLLPGPDSCVEWPSIHRVWCGEDGLKRDVNRLLLRWIYFSVFLAEVLVGSRKQFINNIVFPVGPVPLVLLIIIIEPFQEQSLSLCRSPGSDINRINVVWSAM